MPYIPVPLNRLSRASAASESGRLPFQKSQYILFFIIRNRSRGSSSMNVTAPDFASLLAPYISGVPEDAVPAFLALLERTAAERYRHWAGELPEHAEGLLRCAAREDEIADAVESIYPATTDAQRQAMDSALGPAKDTYYEVFANLTTLEQLAIQANAERQGAAAWRNMIPGEQDSATAAVLETCARTEEASADYLDALLSSLATG
jgi:hypothetical protein